MIITGMEHFQKVCREALVKWYNLHKDVEISYSDTFVVWSCKALQNYKCLVSTSIKDDNAYAEYTYNGDRQELYEDVYEKITNQCIKE